MTARIVLSGMLPSYPLGLRNIARSLLEMMAALAPAEADFNRTEQQACINSTRFVRDGLENGNSVDGILQAQDAFMKA